jgi:uncharacterized pyridoxal phosphate-dependent enzyme
MLDVFAALGVSTVINAAGTLTAFSGSLVHPEVTDVMAASSRSFVDMTELHLAAGKRVAELIDVEAAHVCSGAAAGIALMAAACMAGTDKERIAQLPDTRGMRDAFVVQRAHRNPFDQAIRVAGGRFVEVDADPGALEAALSERTAAVCYTLAWFCREEALPLPQLVAVARRADVPVIVDAAAEIPPAENLSRFVQEGADLVAFSGGKALRGPQASGFVVGRSDLVEACRLNDCPQMGVGRPMKAGKEEIMGLVKAVELYVAQDHQVELAVWERRVAYIIEVLSELKHVRTRRQLPYGLGQQIPHVALNFEESVVGLTYEEVVSRLLSGRPRIAVQLVSPRHYDFSKNTPTELRVHPHTLREGEEYVVGQRLREVLTVAS